MASEKMHRGQKVRPTISSARRRTTLSKVALEHMVDEATVDAYGESEQACGFYTMLENDLELPFNTAVLGADVTVERIDLTDDDHIVAVCRRGQEWQRLPILDLPLPEPPPKGWEWIAAYRHWAKWAR
jgi:Calcium binding